ncbi:zinc finger containing protein [Pochonia chlamydosporia 170]|uniref:Zinc finger containing protein n=1 Tax=Pochonia chlamydosporia 170 TaxID=1380566 RepID=A0A179FSA1_METCM|nr:zinc finger containing protein [Pochonia chlamydosporia 170]OAQ68237.1 zinc finger containing protein [Pochonia chlamydosporia 170]
MSHSKRNTSRAVFTSHERALAKANWSSSSARLNRDSFLPFGSCGLCLEIVRDPVACQLGDIFCRECALANLLAQKKEIKRADKSRHGAQQEAARAKAAEDDEDTKRAVLTFEKTQAGLTDVKKRGISDQDDGAGRETLPAATGTKRKFALDEDELLRIAKADKAKARKAIDDEKAAKPTLPSFWTPSLTPDVQDSKLAAEVKNVKTTPTCPASTDDNPHAISMQKLVTVHFQQSTDPTTNKGGQFTCPSCLKSLSNSSSPVMAQPCGHVLCLNCVKKFLVPQGRQTLSDEEQPLMCYVCDTPVVGKTARYGSSTPKLPAGLVLLKSEGTGFSARGSNTVERSGVAFQC